MFGRLEALWDAFGHVRAFSGVFGQFGACWGAFVSAIFSKWFHVEPFMVLCCGGFPVKSSVCGQV
jgi:hypothetical protein